MDNPHDIEQLKMGLEGEILRLDRERLEAELGDLDQRIAFHREQLKTPCGPGADEMTAILLRSLAAQRKELLRWDGIQSWWRLHREGPSWRQWCWRRLYSLIGWYLQWQHRRRTDAAVNLERERFKQLDDGIKRACNQIVSEVERRAQCHS